jgi:transcription elongation GreA/GreB family factor
MAFIFLEDDFNRMNAQIAELVRLIKAFGEEMGKACQEGAETFHDNFAYEDGERQQRMWGERLREMVRVRDQATVVTPQGGDSVAIGRVVTVRDVNSGETRTFRVGSYWVMGDANGTFSYQSPFVQPLLGAKVGDERECQVRGRSRLMAVVSIK